MDFAFYKLLHIFGAFLVLGVYAALGVWAMNERPSSENKYEKMSMIAHGIGLLVILIGGFGMASKISDDMMSLGWIHIKLTLWLALGGGITLLRKKPEYASWILLSALGLIILASSIGINHYSWFKE